MLWKSAGIFGEDNVAALNIEKAGISGDVLDIGELHKLQESIGLAVGKTYRAFNPVGKGYRPAGFGQTGSFGDNGGFVFNVAPCIFAPYEIKLIGIDACIANIAKNK